MRSIRLKKVLLPGICALLALSHPFAASGAADRPVKPGTETNSAPASPSNTDPQNNGAAGNKDATDNPPKHEMVLLPEDAKSVLFRGGLVLIGFIALLHLWDSIKAYSYSTRTRDGLLQKLPDKLSAEQIEQVSDVISRSPDGIPGTTRSIVTYTLIFVLAAGIFYMLVVCGDCDNGHGRDSAEKLLTLLSGSFASVIGFYFGAKATTEGLSARPAVKSPAGPDDPAHIDAVVPPEGNPGDLIDIRGGGFGTQLGNVVLNSINIPPSDVTWSDTTIRVRVPNLPSGGVDITVNPASGQKVVAHGLFRVP